MCGDVQFFEEHPDIDCSAFPIQHNSLTTLYRPALYAYKIEGGWNTQHLLCSSGISD
jgi:hypothetical protein